jgi:hypothetical protein
MGVPSCSAERIQSPDFYRNDMPASKLLREALWSAA